MPADVLTTVVKTVHAVGGRVAVHSQNGVGGAHAVAAGVDSVEHGMCMDQSLLSDMAERGIALTPTLSVLLGSLAGLRDKPEGPRKEFFLNGINAHPPLVAAAAEAGVTILAGTDSRPHGRIADEVRALAEAGMRPHDALAAASWTARAYLGLPGLAVGAPADAVVYPRTRGRTWACWTSRPPSSCGSTSSLSANRLPSLSRRNADFTGPKSSTAPSRTPASPANSADSGNGSNAAPRAISSATSLSMSRTRKLTTGYGGGRRSGSSVTTIRVPSPA